MIECKINCCRCQKYGTCEHSQERLFEKLFTRYGYVQKEMSNKTIHIYEQHPENLHSEKEILERFSHAKGTIEELEEMLLELKSYQIELSKRYNYILTSPIKKKIELKREKFYRKNVIYYINFYDVNLNDGHEELTNFIKYSGIERKQALLHFEQLKKENPNAFFKKDIERSKWEK